MHDLSRFILLSIFAHTLQKFIFFIYTLFNTPPLLACFLLFSWKALRKILKSRKGSRYGYIIIPKLGRLAVHGHEWIRNLKNKSKHTKRVGIQRGTFSIVISTLLVISHLSYKLSSVHRNSPRTHRPRESRHVMIKCFSDSHPNFTPFRPNKVSIRLPN